MGTSILIRHTVRKENNLLQDLKDLYFDLIKVMNTTNVAFWDTDIFGPGMVINTKKQKPNRVVVIGGIKTWKKRVFVLAHEVGHIYYLTKMDGFSVLVLRKNVSSENSANKTACKILDEIDVELKKEFIQMYNRLNKNSRRKQFKL